jgi:hypothetical protein
MISGVGHCWIDKHGPACCNWGKNILRDISQIDIFVVVPLFPCVMDGSEKKSRLCGIAISFAFFLILDLLQSLFFNLMDTH